MSGGAPVGANSNEGEVLKIALRREGPRGPKAPVGARGKRGF